MSDSGDSKHLPKYVHIDMKGGPPKLSYLLDVMNLCRDWGASGLVIEWEDMFPWSGTLSSLSRPGHYTPDMVGTLLDHAVNINIDVVPLIQTFGHMEFVLKHEQFKHLRDVEMFPNCLRPICADGQEQEVRRLLTEMIRQIIDTHPGLKRIHLGCDEVWSLGQSPMTREYMEKMNVGVTDVFLDHTATVAKIAKEMLPGVTVMVWDDMMRTASVDQLLKVHLDQLVQPVIWNYGSVLAFPPGMLDRYRTVWGETCLWGGSAWRGATGSNTCVTTIRHHVENHLAWLSLIKQTPGMAGIILTGWSRYDHFATLCELLPVSLPSLKCCLDVLNNKSWNEDIHKQSSTSLGLSSPLILEPYMFLTGDEPEHPKYPGSIIYSTMMTYIRLSSEYQAITSSSTMATWLNPWQLKRGFINPLQVQVILEQMSKLGSKLKEVGAVLELEITNYLHDFTAEEWINTNITPKIQEIDKVVTQALTSFK